MKNWKNCALATVLGLAAVMPVYAEDSAAPAAKVTGPCHADFEKFCKDVPKGRGKRINCLKAHKGEVSAECSTHMEEKKRRFDAVKSACKADRDAHCKDKKGKEVRACMKENEAKLSQACQDAKAAARSRKNDMP